MAKPIDRPPNWRLLHGHRSLVALQWSLLATVACVDCAGTNHMILGPCGEYRKAASTQTPLTAAVGLSELVGVVQSRWAEPRFVQLDSAPPVPLDASGSFRFQAVAPGTHVLTTSSIGYIKQRDTVMVPRRGGAFVVVVLSKRAVLVCSQEEHLPPPSPREHALSGAR
jgi:hypothetical protein